ncbi:MAG: type IV pili methyl-accepting chemotaxis transducer N-terminal domain-containing protein [Pseudomonadota bacterium]
MLRRLPTATSLAVSLAGLFAGVAFASGPGAIDPEVANRHTNLAKQQSMLVQQIAKSACFATLGVNASAQMRYLAGAFDLYSRTNQGLRNGNAALGLVEEQHPNMIQALDEVARDGARWTAQATAAARSRGVVSDQAMITLVEQGDRLLPLTQALGERAGRTYGANNGVPLAQTLRIDLAARQRLLSQSMAKSFCLVAKGYRADHYRDELAEAVTLFDTSLGALIDGFESFGLQAETEPTRLARLDAVRDAWSEIRPAMLAVAGGATPSEDQIASVAWANNVVLSLSNAAVFAYETAPAS